MSHTPLAGIRSVLLGCGISMCFLGAGLTPVPSAAAANTVIADNAPDQDGGRSGGAKSSGGKRGGAASGGRSGGSRKSSSSGSRGGSRKSSSSGNRGGSRSQGASGSRGGGNRGGSASGGRGAGRAQGASRSGGSNRGAGSRSSGSRQQSASGNRGSSRSSSASRGGAGTTRGATTSRGASSRGSSRAAISRAGDRADQRAAAQSRSRSQSRVGQPSRANRSQADANQRRVRDVERKQLIDQLRARAAAIRNGETVTRGDGFVDIRRNNSDQDRGRGAIVIERGNEVERVRVLRDRLLEQRNRRGSGKPAHTDRGDIANGNRPFDLSDIRPTGAGNGSIAGSWPDRPIQSTGGSTTLQPGQANGQPIGNGGSPAGGSNPLDGLSVEPTGPGIPLEPVIGGGSNGNHHDGPGGHDGDNDWNGHGGHHDNDWDGHGGHHGHHGHHGKKKHHFHHSHVWCGKCRCSHKPGFHTSVFFSFGFDYYEPFWWPYYPRYDRYDLYYDEFIVPVVYSPPPPPAPVVVTPPQVPTLDEAWYLLKGGLLEDAHVMFAEIITLAPDDAMAHVGHALTSVLLGEPITGIRDMRLAVVLDPEVLRYLPLDEALVLILEDVRQVFVDAVQQEPDDVNALFMVAAIHFALAEDHEAYFAIRRAIDRGDFRESSRVLHDIIDATLAAEIGLTGEE